MSCITDANSPKPTNPCCLESAITQTYLRSSRERLDMAKNLVASPRAGGREQDLGAWHGSVGEVGAEGSEVVVEEAPKHPRAGHEGLEGEEKQKEE